MGTRHILVWGFWLVHNARRITFNPAAPLSMRRNTWNAIMEHSGNQPATSSKYNDSAADAVATLAIVTIVVVWVVFWLASQ